MGAVLQRAMRWGVAALLLLASGGRCSGEIMLQAASAIAYDAAGNLYIADALANRVYEATLGGELIGFAGTGVQGFTGDDGLAGAAELNQPQGIAVSGDGSVWIADTGNQRIRRVDGKGRITTVAGAGVAGFSGENEPALQAQLRRPTALAIDVAGTLLFCDTGNHRVRRLANGIVTTVAGSGMQGFRGDGGPAMAAWLDTPSGVAVAANGAVMIADTHNQRIRQIDASGVIRTFAGSGEAGFAGDGGPATLALLSSPGGLAMTPGGALLIADAGNERVRQVDPAGLIMTLAGTGVEGNGTDGGTVGTTQLRSPRGMAVSGLGMPVIADTQGRAVRVLVGGGALYLPAAFAPQRSSAIAVGPLPAQTYGQTRLAASVQGSVGTAQGELEVLEAGALQAQSSLGDAATNVSLPMLGAGAHSVQVRYPGDGLNPAATYTTALQVEPAAIQAFAASATMEYGQQVPVIAGTLSGVLAQDAGQVSVSFAAAAAVGPLAPGVYAVQPSLTGTQARNYAVSLMPASGQLTVTRAHSVVSVPASMNGYAGLPVTMSVSVISLHGGVPTGVVNFVDGSTVVATAAIHDGQASGLWPNPSVGAHQLSVQYAGDGNFLPAEPASLSLAVGALPDFQMGSGAAQIAAIAAGSSGDYPITVGGLGGAFTGAISFSASGLPQGANVSFSPPQVVPGAGSAGVTVHIQTAATAVAWERGGSSVAFRLAGLFGCIFWLRRRRAVMPVGALAAMLCVGIGLTGCGARSLGSALSGGSKTYTVTVTGTGTNLAGQTVVHSVPLSVTVKT